SRSEEGDQLHGEVEMKHLLPIASVALVAFVRFFAGHRMRSTTSAHELPNKTSASEQFSATTSSSALTRSKTQDRPALTDAHELILGSVEPGTIGSYEVHPAFYKAVRQLDLRELRQLHRRVMAM